MLRFFFCVLLCFIFLKLSAQTNFHKLYRSSGGYFNHLVMTTASNGDAVIACNYTEASNAFLSIIRIDSTGTVVWSKAYQPTAVLNIPVTMAALPDGSVVLVLLDTVSFNNIQLLKLNSNGSMAWTKSFRAAFYTDAAPPLYVMPDGSFYFSHASSDSLLLKKLDTSGNILWQKSYDKPSTSLIIPSAIVCHDTTLYIGGYDNDTYSAFLMKLDTSGVIRWQKFLSGATGAMLNLIATDSGVILSTTVNTSGAANTKVAVCNQAGSIGWTKQLPFPKPKMAMLNSNAIALFTNDSGIFKTAVIDSSGNMKSATSFHDFVVGNELAVSAIPAKGFWLSSISNNSIWLVKMDTLGNSDCYTQTDTPQSQPVLLIPFNLDMTAGMSFTTLTTNAYSPQSISLTDSLLCNTAIPLTLIAFNAAIHQQAVVLQWATENEYNIDYYQIERSRDGRSFQPISKVISENSITRHNYSYIDNAVSASSASPLFAASFYYRLKMRDKDGRYKYGSIVPVHMRNTALQVYPNPVYDKLMIMQPEGVRFAKATVSDVTGTVIIAASLFETTIINSTHWQMGTYILTLHNSKGNAVVSKIIKR